MKLEDDFEDVFEDGDKEDGKDAEGGAVRPISVVLICAGLVVLAALICAILWNVTHSGGREGGINDPVENSVENQAAGPEQEAKSESLPGESDEPETGMEPGENPGPEAGPEPESETAAIPSAAEGEETGSLTSEGEISGVMVFEECRDTVTPKEVVNLRTAPNTGQADDIAAQAVNGEQLERTGINRDTGWSRLEYGGQTLYAVSSYLTTDLDYQPPAAVPDPNSVSTKDGRTITFTDCDDTVSPKIYVNLRLEPSTSEGSDTVHCRLEYGEEVHRTGISEESGWSRVEYDGHVLYVVTSYIYVVEKQ